jgi:hemicentin
MYVNGSLIKIMENQETKIRESSNVQLNCLAIGNPEPEVKWFKNGLELEGHYLNFDAIEPTDSGFYECQISSKLGLLKRNFSMSIQFPPKISNNVQDFENRTLIIVENNPVEIKCEANGNPLPEIHWIHNEIYVDLEERSRYNVTNNDEDSTIKFSSILSDSGVFRCFKNNSLGFIFEDYYLVIHGPPKIIPPNDEYIKVKSGDRVVLECDAIGYPQVSKFSEN